MRTSALFPLGVAFAALFAFTLQAAAQGEVAAQVQSLRGKASIEVPAPEGQKEAPPAREAAEGDLVPEGATFTTSGLSEARLLFPNGALITVTANTRLTLRRIAPEDGSGPTRLRLHAGEIVGDIPSLAGETIWEVETAVATAGVRGTVLGTSFDPAADTSESSIMVIEVNEGDGYFFLPREPGNVIDMPSGTRVIIEGDEWDWDTPGGGPRERLSLPDPEEPLVTPFTGASPL